MLQCCGYQGLSNSVNEALVNSINSLVSTAKPFLDSVRSSSNSKSTKQFSIRAVSVSEICSAIDSLANSPATGCDDISLAMLRKLSCTAFTAIMRIFNMSVSMEFIQMHESMHTLYLCSKKAMHMTQLTTGFLRDCLYWARCFSA